MRLRMRVTPGPLLPALRAQQQPPAASSLREQMRLHRRARPRR